MALTHLVVRRADPAELLDVARVRAASWRRAYAGLVPDAELEAIGTPDRLRSWAGRTAAATDAGTLVAVSGGRVIGFSAYGAERSDLAPAIAGRGEVYALYVHPDAWGAGAGYALMTATLEALHEQGYDAVSLWVLSGNARGIAFYERQGFAPTGEVTASSIDALPESRYSRRI
ncbi:MAG: GNAT family N-acetyltransferase [Actinomycetales bacterium]|nr:GNAT family N-acetyltransferase [Actinomycetales bacterium]